MFIKPTFKDSKNNEKLYIKMQSVLVFLNILRVADFW